MFSNYKPTWMVEAIYQITPAQLKESRHQSSIDRFRQYVDCME